MVKRLLSGVWKRVVLSYKSTLVGVAAGVGILVAETVTQEAAGQTSVWWKVAATLAVVVGAALKSKALPVEAEKRIG